MSTNDALVARRNAIVDRHIEQLKQWDDVRLSFWAFEQYQECPQRYIMHCVGDRIPVKKDNFFAISGSVVHSLWEHFTKGVKKDELDWSDKDFLTDNVSGYYDKFIKEEPVDWVAHDMEPAEHRTASLPEIEQSVSWLYDELARENLIPRDPATVHSELSFRTRLGTENSPVSITGRCDLVFEDPDRFQIVDLKDVADRSKVKWRQLIWYALGLEPVFRKPCSRSGFLLTRVKDWSWRNPDRQDYRQKLTVEILEAALKIRRDTFKAKVNRHRCSYCPVQSICPEWQHYSSRSQVIRTEISGLSEGKTSF